MMNKLHHHIPTFVDWREPYPSSEFSTTDELLSLDVVRRYAELPKFSHFAMHDNALIAVLDDGFHWWVVGHVADPAGVDLPEWAGWKFRAVLPNGKRVVLGKGEVVSACGDELTLRNGTKARVATVAEGE